jgi:hypothetical protein
MIHSPEKGHRSLKVRDDQPLYLKKRKVWRYAAVKAMKKPDRRRRIVA